MHKKDGHHTTPVPRAFAFPKKKEKEKEKKTKKRTRLRRRPKDSICHLAAVENERLTCSKRPPGKQRKNIYISGNTETIQISAKEKYFRGACSKATSPR